MVAGIAGLVLGAAGLVRLATMGHAKPTQAGSASADGVFRPTAEQWRSLTVESVQDRAFDRIEMADGRIEADADRTTPIISPFTGQVTDVFVSAGQRVRRREPLFAVAATEGAQARADLGLESRFLHPADLRERFGI